jgi:hypothetical protein
MRALMFGLLIALAGCTPAGNDSAATAAPAPAAPAPAPAPAATVEKANPGAPAPAPEPAQRAPAELLLQGGVDYACNTPADCAVKNVGNCCGQNPQCVNKDSETFPAQVKAQCARDGLSSVCGFQDIASCDCIEGRCTGIPGAGGGGDVRKD